MDDDFWDDPDIQRKVRVELHDPEKLRAIEEEMCRMLDDLRRWRIKDIHDELERTRRIDSFWKPQPSPYWPERLAYERRKMGDRQ